MTTTRGQKKRPGAAVDDMAPQNTQAPVPAKRQRKPTHKGKDYKYTIDSKKTPKKAKSRATTDGKGNSSNLH